ncbi:MAG: 50S ribosomal protein L24 [Actinomycetota bacterium]|nr:50S ribosomal protein L24 [Actinomycetota bacterium]
MLKLHVKKGDKVAILAGKDRGKKGKVLRVITDKGRVIVEGVNMMKRHTRPTQANPQGSILEKEGSIHASNVRIVCSSCNAITGVSMKQLEKGKVRVCKKCRQDIDK